MVLYQKSGCADWVHYSGLLLSRVQAWLFASLQGNMDLHTFSAKALFGSFVLLVTCSLLFPAISHYTPLTFSSLLFSSPTLWGADQFTASLGGVRLVPALCDWPRLCRPSVMLSCSMSPFPPFSLHSFLSRAKVFSSHFFFASLCFTSHICRQDLSHMISH